MYFKIILLNEKIEMIWCGVLGDCILVIKDIDELEEGVVDGWLRRMWGFEERLLDLVVVLWGKRGKERMGDRHS
ncbi:hypothetical protein, partial [Cytobacillus oceanisediminis]|uniref:hypothetical protein n=1 Tax=Cytobacillus oceanisediminis TaxID=665099 RepID=UPI0011A537FF